jgi:hypothetical protein
MGAGPQERNDCGQDRVHQQGICAHWSQCRLVWARPRGDDDLLFKLPPQSNLLSPPTPPFCLPFLSPSNFRLILVLLLLLLMMMMLALCALQHPSISRVHAAVQFKADGTAYVFDMSTHGTRVNKKTLKQRVYARLRVGDVVALGQSSRLIIFNGGRHPSRQTPPFPTPSLCQCKSAAMTMPALKGNAIHPVR